MSSATSRFDTIDIAKGIGIILVVIGHVCGGIIDTGYYNNDYVPKILYIFIYSFHMPLFFILSGLFVQNSINKKGYGYLKQNIPRLGWSYILWSIIQVSFIFAASNYVNTPIKSDYWNSIISIAYSPPSQFWFLYVLMLMQISTFFIFRARLNEYLFVISTILLISYFFTSIGTNRHLPTIISTFLHFYFYFSLGVVFHERLMSQPL